jgi:hypothetical protein
VGYSKRTSNQLFNRVTGCSAESRRHDCAATKPRSTVSTVSASGKDAIPRVNQTKCHVPGQQVAPGLPQADRGVQRNPAHRCVHGFRRHPLEEWKIMPGKRKAPLYEHRSRATCVRASASSYSAPTNIEFEDSRRRRSTGSPHTATGPRRRWRLRHPVECVGDRDPTAVSAAPYRLNMGGVDGAKGKARLTFDRRTLVTCSKKLTDQFQFSFVQDHPAQTE